MSDKSRERTVLKGVIMGQAVADLPDPLEDRPEPAGGNDELLSQLAGDEIDRLLADEEDSPDAKLSSGRSLVEADADPAAAAGDMGDFLNKLGEGHRPGDLSSAAPADAESAAEPADSSDASEPLLPPESAETDAAERAALEIGLLDEAIDAEAGGGVSTPLLLRPLVWINAPLDLLPEGIRAGVGKVALITFFNALAILVYVLIFRRA
jgi:hypothetical protein